MHPFMLIGGVLHATALLVIAFFVWFAAAQANGGLKTMGRVLGAWLVVLAIAALVLAVAAPSMGLGAMGRRHMGGWMTRGAPSDGSSPPAANSTN